MNNFERKWTRRYTAEIVGAIIIYSVILFVVRRVKPELDTDFAKAAYALLPMVGVFLAMWAIGRGITTMDELQRRMALETVAWSAGWVAAASLAYGFLETGLGFPRLSMFVVWPFMGLLWMIVILVYVALGRMKWIWPWSRS